MELNGDQEAEEFHRVVAADLTDLAVFVGLMSSVSPRWPEFVQENWQERMRQICKWVAEQKQEIMDFAKSYDQEGEEEA